MKQFDAKMIEDPKVFADNRLPAHADLKIQYRKTDGDDVMHPIRFLSLDGMWNFAYAENLSQAVRGFERMEYDCHDWVEIRVPGHMQLQGYDIPHYTNTAYPWDGKEDVALGCVPRRFNPVGEYVKYFTLPEEYLNQEIRISFQGVESGAAVWLNGQYAGYFENSFDPAEFDITKLVKAGENKLAVQVFKWTSGSWFEDQDFFRFSGIYRSVYLYVVPKLHMEDLTVRTILDDQYRDAVLSVDMRINSRAARAAVSLWEEDGETPVLTETASVSSETHLEYPVSTPRLWSAEHPHLYLLRLELLDEAGNTVERIEQPTGFRRFEIRDGIMLLNGKRIVLKGVNRHEFSAHTGRTVTDEQTRQDIITMKQNNINAVRTSHYPDNVSLYDLCDRYGIYLLAENNMETHGTWNRPGTEKHRERVLPGDDRKWEPMLLDRVYSCYQRDKNHPSILIWSCGNESYGGAVIQHMADLFRRLDPDRLVHYEGVFQDRSYPDISDIESQMYTPAAKIQEFLARDRRKPFICCEYSHAMGNSCGALHKYTDLTDTEPSYQGGFIWDYIDQSLDAVDRYGHAYQAYGGDFGDRPTDGAFSGNGLVYADDRMPSPKMQEVRYDYQSIRIQIDERNIHVMNRNLFTDTQEYTCLVSLYRDGIVRQTVELTTAVPPLEERVYPMPDWNMTEPGEYLVIVSFQVRENTMWCRRGHEVAFGQYVYPITAAENGVGQAASGGIRETEGSESGYSSGEAPFEVIRGAQNTGVRGADFEILFSHDAGGPVSYRVHGQELFIRAPKPNFWRAPTANDDGNRMAQRMAQWKIASLYSDHRTKEFWKRGGPEMKQLKDAFQIRYTYQMPTRPTGECAVTYTVLGDGRIQVRLSYDPVEELGSMPEFGMLFILDADFDQVEWYGLGPEETYADRKRGGKLGIYRNRVPDNMARYLVPQECGNKEEVRYMKVTNAAGRGIMITGDRLSMSALPYTPHELEHAGHRYELPSVHHTVIRVALAQMGVGGDDSWGARVHPEYEIDISGRMELEFTLQGL